MNHLVFSLLVSSSETRAAELAPGAQWCPDNRWDALSRTCEVPPPNNRRGIRVDEEHNSIGRTRINLELDGEPLTLEIDREGTVLVLDGYGRVLSDVVARGEVVTVWVGDFAGSILPDLGIETASRGLWVIENLSDGRL